MDKSKCQDGKTHELIQIHIYNKNEVREISFILMHSIVVSIHPDAFRCADSVELMCTGSNDNTQILMDDTRFELEEFCR